MSTSVSKILANYLIQLYLLKGKSIIPLPLMFSWEIYEFFRSSHQRCFMKKAALKNFAIFTGGKLQACNFEKADSSTSFFLWQWCKLTLVWRFWVTKVCLQASEISKICWFSHPTGRATSCKAKFENYSRYYLIKFYQFLSI